MGTEEKKQNKEPLGPNKEMHYQNPQYILNCSFGYYLKRIPYEIKSTQQLSLENLFYAKPVLRVEGTKKENIIQTFKGV